MWRFVYSIIIMQFEFYNYKILTSGEYISDKRRTNPDLFGREGLRVGPDIDRCISTSITILRYAPKTGPIIKALSKLVNLNNQFQDQLINNCSI